MPSRIIFFNHNLEIKGWTSLFTIMNNELGTNTQYVSRKQPPRIAIRSKGRILFFSPSDVVSVEAQGNYVLLQRQFDSYLLRESISKAAENLGLYGFVRIHRSVLVNSALVEEIQPCAAGDYAICLKGGRKYTVTRTYRKNLTLLAESWIGTGRFLAG